MVLLLSIGGTEQNNQQATRFINGQRCSLAGLLTTSNAQHHFLHVHQRANWYILQGDGLLHKQHLEVLQVSKDALHDFIQCVSVRLASGS